MTDLSPASILGRSRGEPDGTTDFYECTGCQATFDAWPGACPECDQLVVRVVRR